METKLLPLPRVRLSLTAVMLALLVSVTAIMASPVFAATISVSLTAADTPVNAGDTGVTVTVQVDTDEALEGVSLDVGFDNTVLTLTDYTVEEPYASLFFQFPANKAAEITEANSEGVLGAVSASGFGDEVPTGLNDFLTMTFDVAPGASAGSYPLDIVINDIYQGGENITGDASATDGTITVGGPAAAVQISLDPSTQNVDAGDTGVEVGVVVDTSVALEGVSLNVEFDNTILTLVDYELQGVYSTLFFQFPANKAAEITEANAEGSLGAVSASGFGDEVPAGTDTFLLMTFDVDGAAPDGASLIDIVINDVFQGGSAFTDVSATGGDVNVGGGAGPTPTPQATSTPIPPPPPGSEDVVVEGSVAAGELVLEVPTGIQFAVDDLERGQDNTIGPFGGLSVAGDVPWELFVQDPKAEHKGHMTNQPGEGGEALVNPLRIQVPGFQEVDLRIPAAPGGFGPVLANGSGDASSAAEDLDFSLYQRVETEDNPGTYSITLRFTLVSVF